VLGFLVDKKKLAKVNIPTSVSKLGKATKINKICVLEMDNNYDVQRPKKDHKVAIRLTYF
jgi:hypothetical protein